MLDHPSLVSIQVGLPREIGTLGATDPIDQAFFSGFDKRPISGAAQVTHTHVVGDGQADLSVHGGPDRPILAYCAEHYDRWQEELGVPRPPYGAFGENFTITGLDESQVCLGDRYAVGPIVVEASQPRQPCWKLARRWRNNDLPALVIEHNRGGWYFRVLQEGAVEAGMAFELLDRPYPQWTIRRANHIMYHGQNDLQAMRELGALPSLSDNWKQQFHRRLGTRDSLSQ